jgi:hypothetical protein
MSSLYASLHFSPSFRNLQHNSCYRLRFASFPIINPFRLCLASSLCLPCFRQLLQVFQCWFALLNKESIESGCLAIKLWYAVLNRLDTLSVTHLLWSLNIITKCFYNSRRHRCSLAQSRFSLCSFVAELKLSLLLKPDNFLPLQKCKVQSWAWRT